MKSDFAELDYGLFAEKYPIFQEFQQAVAGPILRHYLKLGTQRKLNILEIGSGEGATTSEILTLVPNSKIVCVDTDSVLINSAKKRLKGYPNSIAFLNEDIFSYLPQIEDNYFDVIASCYVIHNFEETQRRILLKDIYSKLKTGGLFVNGDNYALDDNQKQFRACMWTVKQLIKMYEDPALQYKWTKHRFRDEQIKWTKNNAFSDFKESGFINVSETYRSKDKIGRLLIESVIVGKKD